MPRLRPQAPAIALAFDDKVFDEAGDVKAESNPWAVFQFGYSAYKSGHKDQAAEAYRYAAENGQIGATWKLARMYAAGDGVARDDYEAFKFFSEIVEQDVEPGSREESYVSDALVALGGYLKTGIPGSPVRPIRSPRRNTTCAPPPTTAIRAPSTRWATCSSRARAA